MAEQVVVNRLVPFTPILTEISGIPPVTVEASIGELSQLSEEVQVRVESRIEDS